MKPRIVAESRTEKLSFICTQGRELVIWNHRFEDRTIWFISNPVAFENGEQWEVNYAGLRWTRELVGGDLDRYMEEIDDEERRVLKWYFSRSVHISRETSSLEKDDVPH